MQGIQFSVFGCSVFILLSADIHPRLLLQMATLEQQPQTQMADRSILSQRLDMPQVDLPPEESSVNLTQLVPELDLIGEKSKDKKDESDEEEVKGKNKLP